MVNQIIWYWLTFIFGVIAAGLTYLVTQYYKMWKELKDNAFQKQLDDLRKELQQYTKDAVKETEESHKKLYKAVLDMYARQFIDKCDSYLKLNQAITSEQYNNLYHDFEVYKSLGGNGLGEKKFNKVEEHASDKQMIQDVADTFQINQNIAKG